MDPTPDGALRDTINPICFRDPGKISDTNQFTCVEGHGNVVSSIVSVAVNGVNNRPHANPDSVSTNGTAVTLDVVANDVDADEDLLVVLINVLRRFIFFGNARVFSFKKISKEAAGQKVPLLSGF